MIELDAFIGCVLVMGLNGANDDPPSALWDRTAYPLYRSALSRDRFKLILRTIRFDESRSRLDRQKIDKAAPISDLWRALQVNLANNYYPKRTVTVDEQLFPFRGHTKFTQYIPSKPAKYGIKIFWLCDSSNGYPLVGELYLGKPIGGERQTNIGETTVMNLVAKYHNSGLSVTTDNFFSSWHLARNPKQNGMGFIGTLRANKAVIPMEIHPRPKVRADPKTNIPADPGSQPGEARYCFNTDATLLSLSTKKKCVYFLSTIHDGECKMPNGKEEINDYYNKTKRGVDVMDQKVSKYTLM